MEKFLKIPCNIDSNTNTYMVNKDVEKGVDLAEVHFKDMISTLNFTNKDELLNDPMFLTLNMILDIKNKKRNDIYNELSPLNSPLLWDDEMLKNFDGTPIFDLLKINKTTLENKALKSVNNLEDKERFLKIFFLFYSIIFYKGMILELNNKKTLCFFPILNRILQIPSEDTNSEIYFENDSFRIKSTKEIKANSNITLRLDLTPSYEINFIKYGILPKNLSLIRIPIQIDNINIVLTKDNSDADTKKILKRINKNPKYSELKNKIKKILTDNIKRIENNNCKIEYIKNYNKCILEIYKKNYPN